MPQLDFDGANSKVSADKIQGQSGTTVTIPTGHKIVATDATGIEMAGTAVKAGDWSVATQVAPSTSGNVLTSNGSAWESAVVASSFGDSFRATISANPTLPNNSIVKVTFDSETFDTANKYDHATNYRYTPAAGKYLLTARIGMTAKNDQHNIILIKKNGTTHSQGGITTYDSNNSGDAHVMNLITIVDSNGTDYWEVWYTHQWGSARSLDGSGGANEFSGVRIG